MAVHWSRCKSTIIHLCAPAMVTTHNTNFSSLGCSTDSPQLHKSLVTSTAIQSTRAMNRWLKVHLVIELCQSSKLPRQPQKTGQISASKRTLERILNSSMKVWKWRCGWDIGLETEQNSSFCCITLQGNKRGWELRIQFKENGNSDSHPQMPEAAPQQEVEFIYLFNPVNLN